MHVTVDPALEPLNRLVGHWFTEATHPARPGVTVRGTAVFEWLDGERFLIGRARTDHPDFPDSISVVGDTGRDRVDDARDGDPAGGWPLSMHYFDSRGVFRVYDVAVDDGSWRVRRDAPGFSQRFTGTFAPAGDAVVGRWQLCRDDVNWYDDLRITYRRHQ